MGLPAVISFVTFEFFVVKTFGSREGAKLSTSPIQLPTEDTE